jgi:hypothetical protein
LDERKEKWEDRKYLCFLSCMFGWEDGKMRIEKICVFFCLVEKKTEVRKCNLYECTIMP